jgi:hypothetical protein
MINMPHVALKGLITHDTVRILLTYRIRNIPFPIVTLWAGASFQFSFGR